MCRDPALKGHRELAPCLALLPCVSHCQATFPRVRLTVRPNSSRLPSYQFSNPDRERDSFLIAPATVLALPLAGSDWPSAGHVPSPEPMAVARQRPSAPSRVNSGAWKCRVGMDSGQAKAQRPLVRGAEARACPVDTGMPRSRQAWCSPASLPCCFLSPTASPAPCPHSSTYSPFQAWLPHICPLWCSPHSPSLSDASYPPLQILCPQSPVAPSRSPWLPAVFLPVLGLPFTLSWGACVPSPGVRHPKVQGFLDPRVKLIIRR